ncbi:MAG: transketolase [Pseudomonadota bacterium]|nr:transketolase [Pseudomonadota bacterium]
MKSSRLELANAIRMLSVDAVQKANSGHPGMPMGMADIAEVLWNDFLKHNPADPKWPDRDRFVVSNGHGSMLLYSLLHLSGYALSMEDLKAFRQFKSKTPGHPEAHITPGVETTTGPLGQGLANAVGMAIAESALAARFNREDFTIVDHYTYTFVGDGCLMEGISHEACSLAGTLGLKKLVVFYDDNGISIDGEVEGWFGDDTPARFESYGWQVVRNVDGHNPDEIRKAVDTARKSDVPTLICCKTVIGWGSPGKQGTSKVHGAALGADEVARVRETLKWTYAPFEIPQSVYEGWDAKARGAASQESWTRLFEAYSREFPDLAAEFSRRMSGALPPDWSETVLQLLKTARAQDKPIASRKASNLSIGIIAPRLPEIIGGSADLAESNLTHWDGAVTLQPQRVVGNYINYGVREFGMAAAMNGLALHGGFIPFGGTFLTFSDYARNAIRMAALTKTRAIYVFTHDSIGLGEDGPTHQAVEHAMSLRIIPNLEVWRPGDTFETAVAWKLAVERSDGPSALLLSRQNLDVQAHDEDGEDFVARGAYVLRDAEVPAAVLIATGSEVALAIKAADGLADKGVAVRVVSMPCVERFLRQPRTYRETVLPPTLRKRLALEAGVSVFWRGLVGDEGDVIGVDSYGESAPAADVFRHFGFTVENVMSRVQALLS